MDYIRWFVLWLVAAIAVTIAWIFVPLGSRWVCCRCFPSVARYAGWLPPEPPKQAEKAEKPK